MSEEGIYRQSIQDDINEKLHNLTITNLFVAGMLFAKKDYECASRIAKALLKNGVECDYLQPIIDLYENGES